MQICTKTGDVKTNSSFDQSEEQHTNYSISTDLKDKCILIYPTQCPEIFR